MLRSLTITHFSVLSVSLLCHPRSFTSIPPLLSFIVSFWSSLALIAWSSQVYGSAFWFSFSLRLSAINVWYPWLNVAYCPALSFRKLLHCCTLFENFPIQKAYSMKIVGVCIGTFVCASAISTTSTLFCTSGNKFRWFQVL